MLVRTSRQRRDHPPDLAAAPAPARLAAAATDLHVGRARLQERDTVQPVRQWQIQAPQPLDRHRAREVAARRADEHAALGQAPRIQHPLQRVQHRPAQRCERVDSSKWLTKPYGCLISALFGVLIWPWSYLPSASRRMLVAIFSFMANLLDDVGCGSTNSVGLNRLVSLRSGPIGVLVRPALPAGTQFAAARARSALQSLLQLRLVHPGTAFHGALRRLVAKLSQRAPTRTLMRSQTAAPACRHVVDRRGARLLGLAMLPAPC